MVEDTVNRFNFEFVRPTKDGNGNLSSICSRSVGYDGEGPQLRMEVVPSESQKESSTIKRMYLKTIYANNTDAQRLRIYINIYIYDSFISFNLT